MINQPPKDRMMRPANIKSRIAVRPLVVSNPKPEIKPAPKGAVARGGLTT
jgi:hypothetical protein